MRSMSITVAYLVEQFSLKKLIYAKMNTLFFKVPNSNFSTKYGMSKNNLHR